MHASEGQTLSQVNGLLNKAQSREISSTGTIKCLLVGLSA